jgi:2-succinyl-6-hydroxy-2,4-cyclohexadiene-1-carboxylate synthase
MQRSHYRLSFLHGFLGSPQDWEGVIGHLPEYSCEALSYPFQIPRGTILIGYSMGGRIALRSSNPKIVLSTHPGLQTPEKKAQRLEHDREWIRMLEQGSLEDFLKTWYAQPLFDSLRNHPEFPKIFSRRLKQDPQVLAKMLSQESLAHQEFTHSEAIFLHGQLDKKFVQLYQDLKIPSLEIPNAGHAAHLENPKGCAEAIRQGIRVIENSRLRLLSRQNTHFL